MYNYLLVLREIFCSVAYLGVMLDRLLLEKDPSTSVDARDILHLRTVVYENRTAEGLGLMACSLVSQ